MNQMLEKRHDRFARLYVANNFNGTKAAIEAGYAKAGARVRASKLLTKDNVKKKWLNI